MNLGEAEDQRFQLSESAGGGRVLKAPEASRRVHQKRFRQAKKGFGQQALKW